MLVELRCKTCGAILKQNTNMGTYFCEYCDTKYVPGTEDGEIIDSDELIKEGYRLLENAQFNEAQKCFLNYIEYFGIPRYDAYLGLILSVIRDKNIIQISNVENSKIFVYSIWRELVKSAGENAYTLLELESASIENFREKMKAIEGQPNAEIIDSKEILYMSYYSFASINKVSEMYELVGNDSVFAKFNDYYIIPCTARDKSAEFYEKVLKGLCGNIHANVIFVIPFPNINYKDSFIEKMLEYANISKIELVIAFVNNTEKIKRIYQYSNGISDQYDVPNALLCYNKAYLQGNRLILADGNTQRIKDEEIEQYASWIRAKKCRYCGGEFVGNIFSKKCRKCGKNKDY